MRGVGHGLGDPKFYPSTFLLVGVSQKRKFTCWGMKQGWNAISFGNDVAKFDRLSLLLNQPE